jgi:cytochrome P450
LSDEGVALLIAGTETTATMSAYGTYFFLRFPRVQDRILAELNSIEKDEHGRLPIVKIEAQPYFVGTLRAAFLNADAYHSVVDSIC